MSRSVQTPAYARPSALGRTGTDALLGLETSGGSTPSGTEKNTRFFSGFLTSPRAAARGLLAVADVAGARYHQPRPAPLRDPVVTGNGDRLRFESFSACCGVHARLDIGRAGLDGARTGHGTTNVDVNNPLRTALSRMTGDDPLHLRAEFGAAEAVRFLRSLPGAGSGGASRGATWVVPAGGSLRRTSRPGPGAVCLPGPERLAALQRVLRDATALRVYGPASDGAVTLDGTTARVASGDRYYQVRERAGVLSCTCRWWADHRGGRGPCKHALAVRMARREGAAARPGPVRSGLAGPPGAVGHALGGQNGHRTAAEGETSAVATGGTR
ncbi:SWIM zinc finger family protein [Streptomyces sp. NPDC095613]|uniref:SWIM zinc finger family protein n=1 Tax=Streptomyces sp. NPDC095613 TaxID=3155540 RepID=UPI00331EE433